MVRGFESTDAPINVDMKNEQLPSTSNTVKIEVDDNDDDEMNDDRSDAMKTNKIVHKEDTVNGK